MIVTERLRLLPLPLEDHRRLARGGQPASVAAPPDFPGGSDPVPAWLHERHAALVLRDPRAAEWVLRAIVTTDGRMAGHIGFHDVPRPVGVALADPSFTGTRPSTTGDVAEFGYTVFAPHRGRGYATEAARALADWALGTGLVEGVLATTAETNLASQRVLLRAGLEVIGRCRDLDGTPELVWWRARPD